MRLPAARYRFESRLCVRSRSVDCVVGGWRGWSPCTASCGGGGVTTNRPVVRVRAEGAGRPCPRVRTQLCGTVACPSDARQAAASAAAVAKASASAAAKAADKAATAAAPARVRALVAGAAALVLAGFALTTCGGGGKGGGGGGATLPARGAYAELGFSTYQQQQHSPVPQAPTAQQEELFDAQGRLRVQQQRGTSGGGGGGGGVGGGGGSSSSSVSPSAAAAADAMVGADLDFDTEVC